MPKTKNIQNDPAIREPLLIPDRQSSKTDNGQSPQIEKTFLDADERRKGLPSTPSFFEHRIKPKKFDSL